MKKIRKILLSCGISGIGSDFDKEHCLMRFLFYCNSMLSLAPYMRTFAISRALCAEHDVHYIFGGPAMDCPIASQHFKKIVLPAFGLYMPERSLRIPEEGLSAAEFMQRRERDLLKALEPPYDFFITELFPFSALEFKGEVLQTIEHLRRHNPQCRVICSLRDIMDQKALINRMATVQLIQQYYDAILVHGDPAIMPLERSCPFAGLVADKIFYTGFIPNNTQGYLKEPRGKQIIVSNGTGVFGDDFILAIAQALAKFTDHTVRFLLGPLTSDSLRNYLEEVCKQPKNAHLFLSSLVENYCQILSRSCLSIGLAGYSLVDVVSTKTPALVYPIGFYDQFLRAKAFAEKGYVKIVEPKDVFPQRLVPLIDETLSSPYPTEELNIAGVANSLKFFKASALHT